MTELRAAVYQLAEADAGKSIRPSSHAVAPHLVRLKEQIVQSVVRQSRLAQATYLNSPSQESHSARVDGTLIIETAIWDSRSLTDRRLRRLDTESR